MKNFLFVMRRSLHDGVAIRENLDMLMTAAAFDQVVRILFLDDGVFQLKSGQRPQTLGWKPIEPLFAALEIYDVEDLWVEEESLVERGLNSASLMLPTRRIRRADIASFVAAADIVVGC